MCGWAGKILEVDLTQEKAFPRETTAEEKRLFLGGRGLGVKILAAELTPKADPLASENLLVFAAGPLTGTPAPAAGRHAVTSKSPLTGTIFTGTAGGIWGRELKRAGYDALVIRGRAKKPLILFVRGEEVRFEEATSLWGKNVPETVKALEKRGKVACIGRAGEKKVLLANIMHTGEHACGRGGLGAVMGSKNLKAIVVKGSQSPQVARPEAFKEHRKEIERLLVASPVVSKGLALYGTPVLTRLINHLALLPVANFRYVSSLEARELTGEKIAASWKLKRSACASCPVGCKRKTAENEAFPEYEALAMLGANCGCFNLEAILELNRLCNAYGLDTISTGSTLACFAEIAGRDSLDAETLKELVREIGERERRGEELAEGAARYAASRGQPAKSMTVKGLEIPAYDPRGARGLALAYATSTRGGCHLRAYLVGPEVLGKPKLVSRATFQGKPGLVAVMQDFAAALDSLVVCLFLSFAVGEEELAGILAAATGEDFRAAELLRVGERIWNLERLFNLRAGFRAADDCLPARFFAPSEDGKLEGIKEEEFREALAEYYRFRGWDKEGVPPKEKLLALGVGENVAGD